MYSNEIDKITVLPEKPMIEASESTIRIAAYCTWCRNNNPNNPNIIIARIVRREGGITEVEPLAHGQESITLPVVTGLNINIDPTATMCPDCLKDQNLWTIGRKLDKGHKIPVPIEPYVQLSMAA